LYYTASGVITPVGGRPMHRLRKEVFSQPVVKADDTYSNHCSLVQRVKTFDLLL